eukprot:1079733-Pelagomonas_calceolata.AAC.2
MTFVATVHSQLREQSDHPPRAEQSQILHVNLARGYADLRRASEASEEGLADSMYVTISKMI